MGLCFELGTGGAGAFFRAGLNGVSGERFLAIPGQALVCELYREGGVRGFELGSFAFPDTDRPELVRLAVPRRTYHREHFEHVAEAAEAVLENPETVSGLQLASDPSMPEIRHFTAELEPRPA